MKLFFAVNVYVERVIIVADVVVDVIAAIAVVRVAVLVVKDVVAMETVVVVDVVVVVVVGLPSLQLIKQAGVLKFIVCCAPEDGPFVNSGRVWERRRSVCPLCVRPHASVCV